MHFCTKSLQSSACFAGLLYKPRAVNVREKGNETDAWWYRMPLQKTTSGLSNGERRIFCRSTSSIALWPQLAPGGLRPFLLDCVTWPLQAASEEGTDHIQWLGASFRAGCGSRASAGLSDQAQELWSCCGSQCSGDSQRGGGHGPRS